MEEKFQIRNETEADYRQVEELIREAFYNLYVPGCSEHYIAHVIRGHEDFISELDFVIESEGKIAGSIMYTRAKLTDEEGEEKEILTFGPLAIAKDHQRKGLGKKLMEHSFKKALDIGYDAVVIFGNPGNYVSSGFRSCKKYGVCLEDGSYPAGMLVKELKNGALGGGKWVYHRSQAFEIDEKEAEAYDERFEKMEKQRQASQEEFYIISNSVLR